VLNLLVRLFPKAFREQFGDGLRDQIRVDGERAQAGGLWAILAYNIGTAADLIGSAVAEHWRPTWHQGVTTGRMMTMGGWTNDLLFAARSLRRAPGFTIAAVATLGLAVGANAGIFSVVSGVLLDPLPFEEPDELVYIAASAPGSWPSQTTTG